MTNYPFSSKPIRTTQIADYYSYRLNLLSLSKQITLLDFFSLIDNNKEVLVDFFRESKIPGCSIQIVFQDLSSIIIESKEGKIISHHIRDLSENQDYKDILSQNQRELLQPSSPLSSLDSFFSWFSFENVLPIIIFCIVFTLLVNLIN